MEENKCKFKCTIEKCLYNTPAFKIYAGDVDSNKYPDIKQNKYRNVSILGELPLLTQNIEYEITAEEEHGKYGISYRVLNIKRDKPRSEDETRLFVMETLTEKQADALLNVYPDIVDRIIENRLDDIDLSKLPGIGKKRFDDIKNKIIENFALFDLVAEFKGTLSMTMLKKMYERFASVEVMREKIKQEPYNTLIQIRGIGFKTADEIVNNLYNNKIIDFGYDIKTSIDRCHACIVHLLRENEDKGNTKMNLVDLRDTCLKLVPSCAHHFAEAAKYKDIYYDKTTMDIAFKNTYNTEKAIAETIYNNIGECNILDCDIEKYRNVGEFNLSDAQLSVVDCVRKNKIVVLNGFAGVGKSLSTKAVINMLDDIGMTYKLLAPTGKAAKVLAEFTDRRASTIHRGLGYIPQKGWTLNEENTIVEDIVIVDEFSMVDVKLFKHLIDAIDFEHTRLLLIGDNAQLASVGCGNLLHDFMCAGIIPTVTLTDVFRYSDGGLMKAATDVRNGRRYLDNTMKHNVTVFGGNKDYTFADIASEQVPNYVAKLYKSLIDKGNKVDDVQVLCSKNISAYGTIAMNNTIQKLVNKNYGGSACMVVGNTTFYKGDIIIQRTNNYDVVTLSDIGEDEEVFVPNGDTGVIIDINSSYADIDFDGIIVRYRQKDMQNVRLGYAITIHSSQGSSINHVILSTPQSDVFMMNSNLLYVGLTRTKKKCYHIGSFKAVNIAIGKKENIERNTFMLQLLKKLDSQC